MASVGKIEQELTKAGKQLQKAENEVTTFKESKSGRRLKELEEKQLEEDLDEREARTLAWLEEKEKDLKKDVRDRLEQVEELQRALASFTTQTVTESRPRSPITELESSSKRARTHQTRQKNLEVLAGIAPSNYATSKYAEHIPGIAIHHHRPASLTNIPVRFYCEIFEKFQNLFGGDVDMPPDVKETYTQLVWELAAQLSDLESVEAKREDIFRKLLDYLLGNLTPALATENFVDQHFRTDGTVFKIISATRFLILNLEVKTDWGTQHNSYLQNAAHYVKILSARMEEYGDYAENTSLPSFLLTLDGTHLMICGAVVADFVCVDKLTPSIPLDMTLYDNGIAEIAVRALWALVSCVDDLQKHYQDLINGLTIPSKFTNGLYPRFPENITYLQRIGTKNLWLAKMEGNQSRYVVKFTRRYGKVAHETCSELGFAPILRYFEELFGGWKLVIMDYLEGVFHNKGFVHGDLRSVNILFGSTGDVKFVDFDWAGKDGEARYPESLNPQINWHKEVGLHKPIRSSHDLHLVEVTFNPPIETVRK
ncbi:13175_t:CDS:2, partial [Ambispora gerdemannii]